VETVSALVTCVAALAAGLYVDKRWAPDMILATVFGAAAGEFCAVVFWGLAPILATMVPAATVDARGRRRLRDSDHRNAGLRCGR